MVTGQSLAEHVAGLATALRAGALTADAVALQTLRHRRRTAASPASAHRRREPATTRPPKESRAGDNRNAAYCAPNG
ncbi:hypothetical protein Val02_02620 [Virgisporangium aliadipatigenens]|uniref:Uncharacterized protein n=1 Tax=Virgisporangium aliadipatigenens TaxID=741659 RepID=A0A8J4DN23_9ACTN|nr:hypothetical protein Val02_02620 [Virgisporangium aliadipatigenens]